MARVRKRLRTGCVRDARFAPSGQRSASMHGRRSVDEAVDTEMTTCARPTCTNPCGEIQAPCEECDAVVCDEHWVWVDGRGVVCVGCLGEGEDG